MTHHSPPFSRGPTLLRLGGETVMIGSGRAAMSFLIERSWFLPTIVVISAGPGLGLSSPDASGARVSLSLWSRDPRVNPTRSPRSTRAPHDTPASRAALPGPVKDGTNRW